jgi:hypothetical protein
VYGWKTIQGNSLQLYCGEEDGHAIMRPLRGMYIAEWDVEHLRASSEPAGRETDADVDKPQLTLSVL